MWAAAILAVAKAFPAAQKILKEVIDLHHEQQDIAAEAQNIKVMREREAIVAAMKQPGLTDDNRAILRRRLWELNKL